MSIQDRSADKVGIWLIQPSQGSFAGQLAALWRHKNVSVALARQVIADGAERKLLGIPWMLVQPLMLAYPAVFILGALEQPLGETVERFLGEGSCGQAQECEDDAFHDVNLSCRLRFSARNRARNRKR